MRWCTAGAPGPFPFSPVTHLPSPGDLSPSSGLVVTGLPSRGQRPQWLPQRRTPGLPAAGIVPAAKKEPGRGHSV